MKISTSSQRNIVRAISTFSLVGILSLALGIGRASAAQLIWDPLNNGATTPASGNWDITAGNTVWSNAITSSDVVWSQTNSTGPMNGAIFNGPDAAPGTYAISLDAVQVAISNLQVNANGYVFSGANAIYVYSSDVLSVAAGKTVTFACNMGGSSTDPSWQLGSGATMNVTGNLATSQQLRLAGAANSAFNLSGVNTPGIFSVLGPVNITGGSLIPSSSTYIGYENLNVINGTTYTAGTLTVSGASTVVTINGNILIIGRSSGSGTLNVQNGAVTVGNNTGTRSLAINFDGSAGSSGTVNVSGGSLTVGGSGELGNEIAFFYNSASVAGSSATLLQSAGTISTWGGIVFGPVGAGVGSASLTQSGGTLLVGASGITKGASYTGTYGITLSGGTVGALANWSSSLPMTLAATTGNTTFQCADNANADHNITLSGPLTGAGGLYVTAGGSDTGTLTLSGANNFTGSTVVSNGTLAIVPGSSPTNGPVTLDGSLGSPTVAVEPNPGQYWSIGTLAFSNGTTTASFQFGALSPSTTVAPIQVGGNVAFVATPNVSIGGTAIPAGTYPLIKYSGAVSGTIPTSLTLPGYVSSAYVTNIVATKTVALVVTGSTYNPALYWGIGNGAWDINTTANWKQFGNPVKYTDGSAVIFDDSASGPSPITVTLNTTVNPLAVTFNNAAPTNYTIAGTGNIAGSAVVSILGSGTVTLAGTNTYSGGTVVSAGQLNINNGGNPNATAIGSGPLTLNAGVTIDDTSGSDVVLQTNIPENWNGSFTYVGSANNFNTGPGTVTMGTSLSVGVNGNNFTVGGAISDNANNYTLTKTGNGTLTLPIANSISGGFTLASGLVNLGDPNSIGQGVLTIQGGSIDNISGASLYETPSSSTWAGSFEFLGSSNLEIYGNVTIPNGLGNMTLNVVSNTFTTSGTIANNNTRVIKTGNGTWVMTGSASGQSLGLLVNGGEVDLDMTGGQAITGGNNVGLTVQSNALVLDMGNNEIHSDSPIPLPVVLSGGIFDMNGHNENVDELSLSDGGILRNSASGGGSTLNTISGYTATLSGTNCQFDVQAVDGVLNFQGALGGSGSLVKIGLGTLNLSSNNVYTGNTVINSGTIALLALSSLSNSATIDLVTANSALDLTQSGNVNGNNNPVLTLQSGQTLSGSGTVTGLVQTVSGATIAPGSPTAAGILTVTGFADTNILNGTTLMKLNKGGLTNDQLAVSGSLVYGGTLMLTNLSGSLAAGDSFTLFSAAGGSKGAFAGLSPSRPDYPAFGLAWYTNNLTSSGTVSIVSAPVPASPRITSVGVSGTTINIRGTNGVANEPFIVLASTNVTLPLTNWVPVLTNNFDSNGDFNLPIGTTTGTPQEFFRLWVQ